MLMMNKDKMMRMMMKKDKVMDVVVYEDKVRELTKRRKMERVKIM